MATEEVIGSAVIDLPIASAFDENGATGSINLATTDSTYGPARLVLTGSGDVLLVDTLDQIPVNIDTLYAFVLAVKTVRDGARSRD